MSTTIEIDVPDDVYRVLLERADQSGMSLSRYLVGEIAAVARRPTLDELTERIETRGSVTPSVNAATIIRAHRGPTGRSTLRG